jgi:hypothetical protein
MMQPSHHRPGGDARRPFDARRAAPPPAPRQATPMPSFFGVLAQAATGACNAWATVGGAEHERNGDDITTVTEVALREFETDRVFHVDAAMIGAAALSDLDGTAPLDRGLDHDTMWRLLDLLYNSEDIDPAGADLIVQMALFGRVKYPAA